MRIVVRESSAPLRATTPRSVLLQVPAHRNTLRASPVAGNHLFVHPVPGLRALKSG